MNDGYPRVTSVIAQLGWNKDVLMGWANRCGLDGKDHADVSGAAARIGTSVHSMIEHDIRGTHYTGDGVPREAQIAFANFLRWKRTVHLAPLEMELFLQSKAHGYQGHPDFIGTLNGKLSLIDWKTGTPGRPPYAEHMLQIAAYHQLWREAHPHEPLNGGLHLLVLSKETEAYDHHCWNELPAAFEIFLCLLRIYRLKVELPIPSSGVFTHG
jgi:hypothetical protein